MVIMSVGQGNIVALLHGLPGQLSVLVVGDPGVVDNGDITEIHLETGAAQPL